MHPLLKTINDRISDAAVGDLTADELASEISSIQQAITFQQNVEHLSSDLITSFNTQLAVLQGYVVQPGVTVPNNGAPFVSQQDWVDQFAAVIAAGGNDPGQYTVIIYYNCGLAIDGTNFSAPTGANPTKVLNFCNKIQSYLTLAHNNIADPGFQNIVLIGTNGYVDLSHNVIVNPSFTSLTTLQSNLILSYNQIVNHGINLTSLPTNAVLKLDHNLITNAGFNNISSVQGTIDFSSNRLTNAGFGNLTSLTGQILMPNNLLTSANFSKLVSVGANGVLNLAGNHLTSVDLSSLTSIAANGTVAVDSNQLSTPLSLPALKVLNGTLSFSSNNYTTAMMDGILQQLANNLTNGDGGFIGTAGQTTGQTPSASSPQRTALQNLGVTIQDDNNSG